MVAQGKAAPVGATQPWVKMEIAGAAESSFTLFRT